MEKLYRRVAMFRNFLRIDDKLWFVAYNRNGLFTFDLNTNQVELVRLIYEKGNRLQDRIGLFSSIQRFGENLFLIPNKADNLYRYNMISEEMICEPSIIETEKMEAVNFVGSELHNGHLYLIPYKYPDIIDWNLKTGKINRISGWQSIIYDEKAEVEGYFARGIAVRENKLFVSCLSVNAIMEMDICSGNIRKIPVDCDCQGFNFMLCDGDDFWLTPIGRDCIIRWNRLSKTVTVIDSFPKGFTGGNIPFISIISCSSEMLAVTNDANMALRIDKDTLSVTEEPLLNQKGIERKIDLWTQEFIGAQQVEKNMIAACSYYDGAIWLLDLKNRMVKRKVIEFSDTYNELINKIAMGEKFKNGDKIICENKQFGLKEMLVYL